MKPSRPTSAVRVSLVAITCVSVTVLAAGWAPTGWIGQSPLARGLARRASAPRFGPGGVPPPPGITATMIAAFSPGGDADADGKADPSDTIRYTVTIGNGGTDATGMHLTDTGDPNTTLVGGSIVISPLAASDTYNSVGNMTLTSSAIAASCGANPLRSITCNDSASGATLTGFGATQGTASATAVNGLNTVTTSNAGTVTLSADGTFVYNPAAGFEGSDAFWYTLSNAAGTDHASVTIAVGGANGMVWFVNSSAGAGNGRQASPFNTLFAFNSVNNGTGTNPAANDTVLLSEGAYTGPVTLLTNQKFIGQDNTAALTSVGAPATAPGNAYNFALNPTATPVSIASGSSAVILASGNNIAGFSVGNSTTAIVGTVALGSLRVREVIVNTNGQGIVLTGGGTVVTDATFTGFTSVTTAGGTTWGINLTNIAGTLALGTGALSGATFATVWISGSNATVTYAGTVNATSGQGLVFSNADGAYNFNGIVTLSGTAGISILSGSSGTIHIAAGSSITSPSATAFNVTGGSSPTVDYNGTITQNALNRRAVNIDGTTGGSITFDGAVSAGAASTGVNINNAAGTVAFTGGLALSTGANAAFTATNPAPNSGTVTVTGSANTLATTTGTALNFTNTTIGAGGLTFRSISTNGAVTGIALNNTGSGAFTVSGTGTPGSGGTIQNSTQRGARFMSANNVSLSWMNFTGNGTGNLDTAGVCGNALGGTNTNCAAGIDMQTVSSVSLTSVHVSGGAQIGINGRNVTDLTLTDVEVNNAGNEANEDGIQIHNLFGTSTWVGLNAHDNAARQVEIQNAGGTPVNLTMTSPQFTAATFQPSGTGAQGLLFSGSVSANMTLNATNATFARNFSAAFQADVAGSATATVVLNGGTMTDVGGFLNIGSASSGNLTYAVTGYTAWLDPAHTNTTPIGVLKGNGIGTITGTISNNTFGDPAIVGSAGPCSGCPTMLITNSQTGATHNLLVSGNTMHHSRHGFVNVTSGGSTPNFDSGDMNVHILDNTIGAADEPANDDIAIVVISGTDAGDSSSTCAKISGNTIGGSYAPLASGGAIRVRNRFADTQFRLPGYAGGDSDTTAVAAFIGDNNGSAAATATVNSNTFGGGGNCHSLVARNDVSPLVGRYARRDGDGRQSNGLRLVAAATTSVEPGDRFASVTRGRSLTARRIAAWVMFSAVRPVAANVATRLRSLEGVAGRLRARMPSIAHVHAVIALARAAARNALPVTLEASPQSPPVDVDLGTLPAGKTITVVFDVTVNTPPVAQYSNQGTVSGSNFSAVPTDTVTTPGDRFDTSTALVSSLNPSNQGDSVTFTATVTPTEGAATPDGTVQFKDGVSNLGGAVACAGAGGNTCSASLTTTTLLTGTRSISAEYSGGTNHEASTSNTVSQVNNNGCTANPVVTTNGDSGAGSLRQAIMDACPGNTITFGGVVSPVDLTSGQLTIDKNLTITGPGANTLTVQRASGTARVFAVNPGVTATIEGLTIANGQLGESSRGAGIYNDRGALTVRNATLSGHSASFGGAIVSNAEGAAATLTLVNSTVSGNTASFGGAIFTQGVTGATSTVSIIDSTISGNTASTDGGGLYASGATSASVETTITNSTMTNNRAGNSGGGGTGGGIYVLMGTVTVRNTIVAGNFVGGSPSTAADDIIGALAATSASNLIGVDTGMTGVTHGTNRNQVGTAASPINPRLGSLASNGGPTFTHAVLAGSPALDAGDNTLVVGATDQRGPGFARILDCADAGAAQTVDVGAFEADPSIEDIADKITNEDTALTLTFSVGDGGSSFASIAVVSSNATLLPNANATIGPDTASTRTLTLTPAAERAGTTTITVTATKTVGGTPVSMSDTFVLTVLSVNDQPTLTLIADPAAILEDAGVQTVNLTGIGAGGGDSQTLTVAATSNNAAVIPHPTVNYTSPNSTGSLSYAPVANASGTAIVTVTVTDDGGGTDTVSRTFTVTVNAVNDDPTISNIADQPVPASTSAMIPFTVGDGETAAGALAVAAISSNQAVVRNTGLVVSSGGAGRTLTLTPVPNTTGAATITVTATDGDGGTAVDTFVVTVVPNLTINDATVAEGHGGGVNLTFTVTLAGPSATPVSVTYATAQRTAMGGVDYVGATGVVSFTPGVTGPSTFTVTANGDTATEIDETLVVTLSGATGGAVITRAQGVGTITDDDATTDRTAELASWARRIGVTASGGSLTKTAIIGWNAGASSTKSMLTGDGFVEFSASATDQIGIAGLSHRDTSTNFADVDFGLQLFSGARYYIVEAGTYYPGIFGAYAAGDRFAVTVTGGVVTYQKNGVTIYTSGRAPTYPLLVDAALYSPGATIVDVVIAGQLGRPVTWTNLVGATASSNALAKTAVAGWNAGAASTRALVAGDGFVDFAATETNTTRMLGLSRDNSSTDWTDIDFALYLYSNATVYVVEGGITRGIFGSYASGDRFQVAIESGQVVYRRNGVLLYTSGVAPSYPLLVDSALFTTGATLTDVALAGTFATDVTFVGAVGASASGNTLTKSAALGWNAGAFSTRSLVKGDGFMEFTTNGDPTHKVAGLSRGNTNTDFTDIDFGIILGSNFAVYVVEGGTSRGVFGTYQSGSRFRVAVEGGVVKYRRNGVLFYTSGVAPAYPLLVDTALYSPAATVADVVLSGDLGEAVAWTAALGVSPSTGLLTKTGALGWNAGAISTRAIASGDGFVSFRTNEATTHKLIGLSTGNTNTDYADVDFGILLASNGTYYVFENGTSRGVFGGYLSGDRFQVGVDGGVVQYLRNGAVFYTSGVAPAYPLLVDTALYTPGATLADVVLSCVSAACQ